MYQYTNTPDVDAPNAQLPDALDPSSKFSAHPLRICTPTSPNLVPAILYICVVATILEEYANQVLSASLTRLQWTLTSSACNKTSSDRTGHSTQ